MKSRRQIIHIDEELCNGCGLCVPSCAEGAIQIIDGKARLVSETFCDGLGACLGECPQGAITMEEREAATFDEVAVTEHLARVRPAAEPPVVHAGCPGAAARMLQPSAAPSARNGDAVSRLANWPVQLHLVPTQAPYFQGAKLLIAADCVPAALPDFHDRMLDGHILLIGCPKLDDTQTYQAKLARIFADNAIQSIESAYMEVPCCMGLVFLVKQALADSGMADSIPLTLTKVGIQGDVREPSPLES